MVRTIKYDISMDKPKRRKAPRKISVNNLLHTLRAFRGGRKVCEDQKNNCQCFKQYECFITTSLIIVITVRLLINNFANVSVDASHELRKV